MSESLENNLFPEKFSDRPFECSECKKKIKVLYTEVVNTEIKNTSMCSDCPELKRRLHGLSNSNLGNLGSTAEGLCCGNCGTTLESIKTGHPLGCSVCYEVFQNLVFQELLNESRIPRRLTQIKTQETLHLGRYPRDGEALSPSTRLVALNEALQSTLAKEDYEQAALIRDQIKDLTEKDPMAQTLQKDPNVKE